MKFLSFLPGRNANTTLLIYRTPLSLNRAKSELICVSNQPTGLLTKIPLCALPFQPITSQSQCVWSLSSWIVSDISWVTTASKSIEIFFETARLAIRLSKEVTWGSSFFSKASFKNDFFGIDCCCGWVEVDSFWLYTVIAVAVEY